MVGVGSPSSLNAFNIGQAATGKSAIGQQIEAIVAQRDKVQASVAQSGAQTAGAIATSQFKNQLENQPQDVLVQRPGGGFDLVEDRPGGKKTILGAPPQTSIPQAIGGQLQQGFQGPARTFDASGQQITSTPTPDPRVDPNLTPGASQPQISPEDRAILEAEARRRGLIK